jgi:probable F420-dependent oxidoreductase
MAHPRKFRFGVQLHNATDGASLAAQARRAEELGFSTAFFPDHFGDQLAPMPALAAVAASTTDLRIGSLVFDNDYKHPVVLAKECATLDVLSGGRLELGIGAGWMKSDYDQSGIPMDPPKVRVDRMVEGIKVIKGAFGDGPFDFAGEHYRIAGYDGLPKSVQKPHPPLLIGGGRKRTLSIAAREGDIIGINPSVDSGEVDADAARSGSAEQTDQKVAWVREAAGDRYADLELNVLIFAMVVTDDKKGTIEMMAPLFGLEPDEVGDHPHALAGTVEEICEDLERRRDRWDISYITVQEPSMEDFAPVVARLAGT